MSHILTLVGATISLCLINKLFLILALRKQRQGDVHDFETNLVYIVSSRKTRTTKIPCLKSKQTNKPATSKLNSLKQQWVTDSELCGLAIRAGKPRHLELFLPNSPPCCCRPLAAVLWLDGLGWPHTQVWQTEGLSALATVYLPSREGQPELL